MRLAMIDPGQGARLAAVVSERGPFIVVGEAWKAMELDGKPPESVFSLLNAGPEMVERVRLLASRVEGEPDGRINLAWDESLLRCPIPRPGKILCVGRNYWEHAEENIEGWKQRGMSYNMPPWPKAFVKVPSSVIGPGEPIVHPAFSRSLDYEVEFAIVIGREAHYVTPDDALDCVAGYTIVNDVTARDEQHREQVYGQHCLGKNFASSAPLGPLVSLSDEMEDPEALEVQLRVNGHVRQRANTRDLIFGIRTIVSHWSQAKLEPGDVITTGTPSGVAAWRDDWWIRPGDVVEAEVEGIGVLRNEVVDMPSVKGDWSRSHLGPNGPAASS